MGAKVVCFIFFTVVFTSPSPLLMDHVESRLDKLEKSLEILNNERKINQVLTIIPALEAKVSRIQSAIRRNYVTSLKCQKSILALEAKVSGIQSAIRRNNYSVTPLKCQKSLLRNCKEVQQSYSNISSIYVIRPESSKDSFMVSCDMKTKEGGWTVFLNRFDGSQDFYLNWISYKMGFGNPGGEFWLGLEHLYQLTGKEVNELLVELTDWDEKTVYAHYNSFSVGSENQGYPLKVLGEYSGDAGDSLTYHAGSKFTTKDKDQDENPDNCAAYYSGAWWHKNCMRSQLTGEYIKNFNGKGTRTNVLSWQGFHEAKYSLKRARMMVRPRVVCSG